MAWLWGPDVHGYRACGATLGLGSGGAEWGGESRLSLGDWSFLSFPLTGVDPGGVAGRGLIPHVKWSQRTRLDSDGRACRGHGMVPHLPRHLPSFLIVAAPVLWCTWCFYNMCIKQGELTMWGMFSQYFNRFLSDCRKSLTAISTKSAFSLLF